MLQVRAQIATMVGWLTLWWALWAAMPALAQNSASLRVEVVGQDELGIPDATVTVSSAARILATQTTDIDGIALFTGLPEGTLLDVEVQSIVGETRVEGVHLVDETVRMLVAVESDLRTL